MQQERKISNSEYQKAVSLLSRLFKFDFDLEKQINGYIHNYGICHFFENLEAFELSVDTIIKLQAVRLVLFGLEGEVSKEMEGGEANNK